jgi:hypothetical protein
MSRKYLLDCSANGAKWADDVEIHKNHSATTVYDRMILLMDGPGLWMPQSI